MGQQKTKRESEREELIIHRFWRRYTAHLHGRSRQAAGRERTSGCGSRVLRGHEVECFEVPMLSGLVNSNQKEFLFFNLFLFERLLLYNAVLVSSYINMNQPEVYMCTLHLEPPSHLMPPL